MGSVKDLTILESATETRPGVGRFHFSDRYSVFDWGEMPNHIPHKGECLCLLTAYFFERMEEQGIKTHYRGIADSGEVKKLEDLDSPAADLEVSLVRVIEPDYKDGEYHYSGYGPDTCNCLVPLEVIYRNTLPEHSSFRTRAENGEIDVADYGLSELPAPGTQLERPILDVSTKLEEKDRYITWSEAQKIAALSDDEVKQAQELLLAVNDHISKKVEQAGLRNLDGKIELAFDPDRRLMVVDAVGTPDECRFAYEGFSISKEAIRKYYRQTQWYEELEKVKKEAGPDWREQVTTAPEPLPEDILNLVSQLYMACANEITGTEWFADVLSFPEICDGLEAAVS